MKSYKVLLIGIDTILQNILEMAFDTLKKNVVDNVEYELVSMKKVSFEFAAGFDLIIVDMTHIDYDSLYVSRLNEHAIEKLKIILVGSKSDYLFVRKVFLSGIYDYWINDYDVPIITDSIKRAIHSIYDRKMSIELKQSIIQTLEGYELLELPLYDTFYRLVVKPRLDFESDYSIYYSVLHDLIEPISFEPMNLSKNDVVYFCTTWLTEQSNMYDSFYILLKQFGKVYSEIYYPFVDNIIVRKAITEVLSPKQRHKSVKYISEVLFVNQSHLSITFKKVTGISLSAYIKRIKLLGAMWMILHENYTLDDILYILEYKDEQHFHRIFKHSTGVLPSNFRRHFKKYHLRK